MNYKITVIGAGYVGLSLSILLSKNNYVNLYDIDEEKVISLKQKKSIIHDPEIEMHIKSSKVKFYGLKDQKEALESRDIYIIATPTSYNQLKGSFDTDSVESTIKDILDLTSSGLIVIKSTIPVGFTDSINRKYNTDRILFSPEFLREGMALRDNFYPSRIIVGGCNQHSKIFGELLRVSAKSSDVEVFYMDSNEAEAVKLFSNSYLALRVSFFNELDSFALSKNLNSKNIITGVSSDPRIGNYYNNPSFGYGGYCLPKDTKQLLANYEDIPQNIIAAIISANNTRKKYIAQNIIAKKPKIVGIYRLVMKQGSDNLRSSSILDVMKYISDARIKIIIYEPNLAKDIADLGYELVNSFAELSERADLIIANRMSKELESIADKVFSRDLFGIS